MASSPRRSTLEFVIGLREVMCSSPLPEIVMSRFSAVVMVFTSSVTFSVDRPDAYDEIGRTKHTQHITAAWISESFISLDFRFSDISASARHKDTKFLRIYLIEMDEAFLDLLGRFLLYAMRKGQDLAKDS